MKWVLIALAAVIALPAMLYLGIMVYYNLVGNDRVAEELRNNPEGERARVVMLLTLPDGRQLPVNYLREGDQVFAGADGVWWRSLRDGPLPVQVYIKGQEYSGKAQVVLDDPDYRRDIFSRLRPTAPAWLPDWLNGKLIVIDLDIWP